VCRRFVKPWTAKVSLYEMRKKIEGIVPALSQSSPDISAVQELRGLVGNESDANVLLSYCAARCSNDRDAIPKDSLPLEQVVGSATVFVSHTWGYKFLKVVDALETWEDNQKAERNISSGGGSSSSSSSSSSGANAGGTTFFFFDIFVNSQHTNNSGYSFKWWSEIFVQEVGMCERTLLVLEWKNFIPLTRSWCLLEIIATLRKDSERLEIVMATTEQECFKQDMLTDFGSLIGTVMSIDVEKAQAGKPEDKSSIDNLLTTSENEGGFGMSFAAVNSAIKHRLQQWMTAKASESTTEREMEMTMDMISHRRALARLSLEGNDPKYKTAADTLRTSKDDLEKLLVTSNSKRVKFELLHTLYWLSEVMRLEVESHKHLSAPTDDTLEDSRKTLLAAEKLADSLLVCHNSFGSVVHKSFGKDLTPPSLDTINNLLALIYRDLAGVLKRLSDQIHPAPPTRSDSRSLQEVEKQTLISQRDEYLKKALYLFKRALEDARTRNMGEDVHTLPTMHNLALVYIDLGKSYVDEAVPLLEQCIALAKKLGRERYEDTIESIQQLGDVQWTKKQYALALGSFSDALKYSEQNQIANKSRIDELKVSIQKARAEEEREKEAEQRKALAEKPKVLTGTGGKKRKLENGDHEDRLGAAGACFEAGGHSVGASAAAAAAPIAVFHTGDEVAGSTAATADLSFAGNESVSCAFFSADNAAGASNVGESAVVGTTFIGPAINGASDGGGVTPGEALAAVAESDRVGATDTVTGAAAAAATVATSEAMLD
jgi:hypothetical protein